MKYALGVLRAEHTPIHCAELRANREKINFTYRIRCPVLLELDSPWA